MTAPADPRAGRLTGLRIAVTGAAGLLGRRLARAFADENCAGLLLGDLDSDGLRVVAESLSGPGCTVVDQALDVTDADAVDAFVAAAVSALGGLDVFVNTVGIVSPSARVHNVTARDLADVLAVNVTGTFNGVRAAVAHMRANGGGTIINTASVAGLTAWSHAAPYCLSKAAVIHLTKVAALEYARERIRVNCVCPGTFRSAIHDGLPESALATIADRHPVGRLADADEIVGAFVYLADPRSSFTTGTALTVDGGYSC